MDGQDHDFVLVEKEVEFLTLADPPGQIKTAEAKPRPKEKASEKQDRLEKSKAVSNWLNDEENTLGSFPSKAHALRVAKELKYPKGLIFLPGQVVSTFEDSDMGPEFRQRRYFYYLAGVDFPGCALTYDIARNYLTLWIPLTDSRRALWYGSTPGPEECKKMTQVDEVKYVPSLTRFLNSSLAPGGALAPGNTLYVLHPNQTPNMDNLKGVVRVDTVSLKPAMDAARVIKSDYEIGMIKRANAISSAAHKAVMTRILRLSNEREIEAIFRGVCRAHGAKHQAYPVIAGSGTNASTLHYDANDQPLEGRQLICVDAGIEWKCYASDITRTLPLSGSFSPEAATIHGIVNRMQTECFSRVRPGITYSSLHVRACIVAVTELLRIGVLHGGTADEILSRGTIAAFFPHGLGHHVGLEVHDPSGPQQLLASCGGPVGSNMVGKREGVSDEMLARMYREETPGRTQGAPRESRQRLERNMVVTIEPGIYFCQPYLEEWFLNNPNHAPFINKREVKNYYPVGGVRIEDCIVITDKGFDNLTSAPKGDEMIKIINAGGG